MLHPVPLRYKSVLLFMLLIGLVSCSQPRLVSSGSLFLKESIPGIIPRGLEGGQLPVRRDTLHFFYLEMKGSENPVIDSIFYKGELFSSSVQHVDPRETEIGRKKGSGEIITGQPSRGNTVWKIELTPAGRKYQRTLEGNPLLYLKGRQGNRAFSYSLNEETELEPDIHV